MEIVQKLEKLPLAELAGDARQTIRTMETAVKSADALLRNVDASVVPEAYSTLKDGRKTLEDVRKTLADVQKTLVDVQKTLDDGRKTLDDGRKALGGAKEVLSPDAPLQQDLRETLREISRAAQALRVLGESLERQPESLIRGKEDDR
jgi:paraquat-inducible protein B